MTKKHRPLLIGTLVLLALGAFVALRFEVTTDLYAFLPEADDRELGALSHQIAQSELSRTMIFALSAPDADTWAGVKSPRFIASASVSGASASAPNNSTAALSPAIAAMPASTNGPLARALQ